MAESPTRLVDGRPRLPLAANARPSFLENVVHEYCHSLRKKPGSDSLRGSTASDFRVSRPDR